MSVLCKSSVWHHPYGPECHRKRASGSNIKNRKKIAKTFKLFGHASSGQDKIPCIRHDFEHPLRRLIPLRDTSQKQTCRIFFSRQQDCEKRKIKINGNIFVSCGILKIVVCSAAEVELAALFLNIKEVVAGK